MPINTYQKTYKILEKKDRVKIVYFTVFALLRGLIEAFCVALFYPFIKLLTDPSVDIEFEILNNFINYFEYNKILTFSFLIFISYLFKNILSIMYSIFHNHFMQHSIANYSSMLLEKYLHFPYAFHLRKNSAELYRNIHVVIDKFIELISRFMSLITDGLILISILFVLLIASTEIAITSIAVIGFISIFYPLLLKNYLLTKGKIMLGQRREAIKWINQATGGIKEIKVLNRGNYFVKQYKQYAVDLAENARKLNVISDLPKLIVELLIVSLVVVFASFYTLKYSDPTNLFSKLGLFAVASFRILPISQLIVNHINSIRINTSSVDIIYNDFVEKDKTEKSINKVRDNNRKVNFNFNKEITINNVSFKYPGSNEFVLRNVCFSIFPGQSMAIVGESGSGKTTLIDLILGLHEPTDGEIIVDSVNINRNICAWQKMIGYIPQDIYLCDDTIRKNVAFGVFDDDINDKQIWKCLNDSQLGNFVSNLDNTLDINIGESGSRLSGGQRQRIGIARALYHNPKILLFDEATSSLDYETEREIINTMNNLKGEKTIIIITHRLESVKHCDFKIQIKDGTCERF